MQLQGRSLPVFLCVSALTLLVSGCALSPIANNSPTAGTLVVSGHVHGGQPPVSGATIQLYAVNTTADMGASTAMLTTPVTTQSDGSFSITNDYTCPASNPLVYIVATGGNPGLGASVNNTGIAMMSLLGSCNSLSSSTFVSINELTTVFSIELLAPFMADYTHVGSSSTSLSGVGSAFLGGLTSFFSTGQFGTTIVELPIATYNTLANILAACVNTDGSGSACSTLFSNTGGSSETAGAALFMVKSPAQNTTTLYGLSGSTPPFQPYLAGVPSDLTAAIGYALPNFFLSAALDSNGRPWIYFGGYNYDTASNTSTDSAGYIQVYDNNFNPLFQVTPGTGGLYYPDSLAADASGHVFAINANNTISEFASDGSAVSPSGGWPSGLPSTFSPSGTGNQYISNVDQGGPIAVDALGNIWGGTYSGASNCYFELNSSGANITPALSATTGTFCTTTGDANVADGALDGTGNAWASNSSTIAKVNAQGVLAATAPTSEGCFYPESLAFTSGLTSTQDTQIYTTSLTFDHVHNQLWGISETGAGTISDAGTAGFCDFGSSTLPVQLQTTSSSTTIGSPFTGGNRLIGSARLDGAGNLWFVTGGINESGLVASSPGGTVQTYTGTATFSSYLNELSPTGVLLSPYNAGTQTYGYQPAGFGANATSSSGTWNVLSTDAGASVGLLGIDNLGNIWAFDQISHRVLKITGMASANTVNY